MTEKKTFAEWMRSYTHVHKPEISDCEECRKLMAMKIRETCLNVIKKQPYK